MVAHKFNAKQIEKLNDPVRLQWIPPEAVWKKLDVKDPAVVVDIGAGTGLFCIQFLQFIRNGKIHAFDIAEEMIQWMKDHEVGRYPEICPEIMRDGRVPMDDGRADVVFMMTLHHELENPEKMMAEAFRIMKEKGKICIIDWKKEDMDDGPPTAIRCKPEDIAVQLETAGFKQIVVDNSLSRHFLVIAEK